MSVYHCTVERAICERADSCFVHRRPDLSDPIVIEFKPIQKFGQYCPHYVAEFESPR